MSTSTATTGPATDVRQQRRTLGTASLGTLLVLIAFVTPLATGVRTAADFAAGTGTVAWLLSSMSVGLAVSLLSAGALADDLGRRRVFTLGLALVAVGSLAAAVAPTAGVFIGARVVSGFGGAAVLACALGLIGHTFAPGPARAGAASVWGASVGAGTGFGGLLAVLVDHGDSWRVTYLVTAVLVLGLAAASRFVLVESSAPTRRRLDLAGAGLLGAGLAAVLAGLVESRGGWGRPVVVLLLVGGAVLLGVFVAVEQRLAEPMIDLALFRVPGFVAAAVGAVTTGAATIGAMSYLASVLQRGLGETLLVATLLIFVWSAVSTVVAVGVRWLPGLDGRVLLAIGLGVSAVGLAAMGVLGEGASGARLLPGLVVLGAGYGAANAALGREAVAHVPVERAAMGSGANNTARYIGGAVGVTLVVLVVAAAGAPDPATLTAGWNHAARAAAVVSLVGAAVVALVRPRRP